MNWIITSILIYLVVGGIVAGIMLDHVDVVRISWAKIIVIIIFWPFILLVALLGG